MKVAGLITLRLSFQLYISSNKKKNSQSQKRYYAYEEIMFFIFTLQFCSNVYCL